MATKKPSSGVFIRAKTSDDRWASVDAMDLDEDSFRRFTLDMLKKTGAVDYLKDSPKVFYTTPLTKEETDG